MLSERTVVFHVAKLGTAKMGEIENTLELAQSLQRQYIFRTWDQPLDFDLSAYLLPNGTYDLDRAAATLHREARLPKPFIFFTGLPYGDRDTQGDPNYTYFGGHADGDDATVSVISTYNWEQVLGREPLQQYILLMLASEVFWDSAELAYHNETRGCLFDYDFDIKDIYRVFQQDEPLCAECRSILQSAIRQGRSSHELISAGLRLFNRSAERRLCFLAMPFDPALRAVHEVVATALREVGWIVQRVDDISMPRRVTDALLLGLLTCDLVVADITGCNPNVFYELGFAHAHARDALLITQNRDRPIPFDVTTDKTVFYEMSSDGLQKLASELKRLVGQAAR